ncbi:MAG TPA: hypothetical protein H9825_10460, partial [Candidatus Sphingobacterium stercorigallinarum]|nr:hypothetical protein [Candidatus Sphingobacterium stercorigallinarum]
MRILFSFILCVFIGLTSSLQAQQADDPSLRMVDDIQFDLRSVELNADTLEVRLFAISYDKNPREFRLNVFASGLVDSLGQIHMLESVQVDRVMVMLADRQNYLNYLLHQDQPVQIILKATSISSASRSNWPQA